MLSLDIHFQLPQHQVFVTRHPGSSLLHVYPHKICRHACWPSRRLHVKVTEWPTRKGNASTGICSRDVQSLYFLFHFLVVVTQVWWSQGVAASRTTPPSFRVQHNPCPIIIRDLTRSLHWIPQDNTQEPVLIRKEAETLVTLTWLTVRKKHFLSISA